jgi:colicin import membrane protein
MAAERERLRREAERLATEEEARLEAELERERQQQLAEEAERLAQDEKRRLAEEESLERYHLEQLAREQAAADERRTLVAQQAREEDQDSQRNSAQLARETERYMQVIDDRVSQFWLRPPATAGLDLVTVILVRLIPGGEVAPNGVSIIRSSGHMAFDQSVVRAVHDASPLPVPASSDPAFERFREFEFTFSP